MFEVSYAATRLLALRDDGMASSGGWTCTSNLPTSISPWSRPGPAR